MKEYKTKSTDIEYVDKIICDICKKSTRISPHVGVYDSVAVLQSSFGYGTEFDGESHDCDMCITCYKVVREFIENTLGGTIHVTGGIELESVHANDELFQL